MNEDTEVYDDTNTLNIDKIFNEDRISILKK